MLKVECRGSEASNNGKIALSGCQAAERLRVAPDTTARAFHDLQPKGFIAVTKIG